MTPTLEQTKKDAATMHVLLVEDDADDLHLVKDYLAEGGRNLFSLESAGRLSAGLDRLSEGGIDAILLDLFLPDSEGLGTFLQAHSRSPRVPIVILTELDDEELAMRAVRQGAQDYLRKEDLSAQILIRALRYAVERKEAEEQLRQAQKMEAIGRVAGGVAHDFNNLLGIILGNCEILQGGALRGDVVPKAVERITQAANSAASLTAQLLAFSRRQALQPVVLNPNVVVMQTCEMLRQLIHESIELVIRTDSEAGCVCGDPGQLEQVILNLAINARDAMPVGGTLTIETQNVDLEEGYSTISGPIEPGRYVMLAVSDTGIGIDVQTQEHIFEPFYTTKANGTGLGLATVLGIVRQSGGHVLLHSAPGCGTTVKVLLPRIDEQAGKSESNISPKQAQRGTETILFVEDNPYIREVVRKFLVSGGYHVIEAGSRDEALTLARAHAGPIDLLLTDVVLPLEGGQEVEAQLKCLHPETGVRYMSTYTDDIVGDHGIPDSGIPVLKRPFTRNQLLAFVREALDAGKANAARGTG